jgi:LEA14-like dessication related protein
MILKIRIRYVILVLLLGVIGYSIYYFIQRQKMINLLIPEVKEITLIKANLHADTAFIEVNMIVENKAPYRMSIDSIICNLSLGGTKIVSVSQYIGLRQESGESDSVKFSVNIPISRTRKKIKSLQNQDSTGVQLEAMIVYSGFMVPFAKTKQIEVPVPPQFRVIKTEKKELRLFQKEVDVDLFLAIINEGKNLSLDIHDLQYRLTVGNDMITKGKLGKDVSIRPRSSQIIKFPLGFEMKHPMKTIFKVWKDEDQVPFHLMLSGYMDAGKMKRIPVVIFASGRMEIVNEQKKKAEKNWEKDRRKEKRQDKRQEKKEDRQEKREDRKEERQ